MDPLSITASCVALVATTSKAAYSITNLIKDARNAPRDLSAIARELRSLQIVTETLTRDTVGQSATLPTDLRQQILDILTNSDRVVRDIRTSLKKHAKSRLGKGGSWALKVGKEDMNKYRSSLEAHKSALQLAVQMVAVSLSRNIKTDTVQILQELRKLNGSLLENGRRTPSNDILHEALSGMSTYAESVCSPSDEEDSDGDDSDGHSTDDHDYNAMRYGTYTYQLCGPPSYNRLAPSYSQMSASCKWIPYNTDSAKAMPGSRSTIIHTATSTNTMAPSEPNPCRTLAENSSFTPLTPSCDPMRVSPPLITPEPVPYIELVPHAHSTNRAYLNFPTIRRTANIGFYGFFLGAPVPKLQFDSYHSDVFDFDPSDSFDSEPPDSFDTNVIDPDPSVPFDSICFDSALVSRYHCYITRHTHNPSGDRTWCIEDNGSRLGTWLNNVRLSRSVQKSEKRSLRDGDTITLGSWDDNEIDGRVVYIVVKLGML